MIVLLRTIILYGFRLFVFAVVSFGVTMAWAIHEGGHGAMGIIAGGMILAGGAVVAWLASAIGSRWLEGAAVRWIAHVCATAIVFWVAGALIYLIAGFGEAVGMVFLYTGIVALAAVADGVIGAWADHRRDNASGSASPVSKEVEAK